MLYPGVKRTECEAGLSSPLNAEIRYKWSFHSPYTKSRCELLTGVTLEIRESYITQDSAWNLDNKLAEVKEAIRET